MTRPLKTLMTVLFLMTAVSVIRTTTVHFDQKRIVKIIDQTHVVEPLTVTDTTVTDSRLSVSLGNVGIFGSRGYNEDDIQGELGVRYDLNNGDTYDDYVNTQDVRNGRFPGRCSVLTKAYYKGTYKLRSGKTVTLTTRRKLKLGKVAHGSTEPVYEGPLMPLSSELNQLIAAHNLLGNAKYSLLEELDNVSFANDEVKAFVLALADYTHDPRTVNLLSNLFDEGIDKWAIGQPCPERFISKPSPNPSIDFEARPIIGVEPVTLILNVGLEDYTPTAETLIDELEYVVIPTDD